MPPPELGNAPLFLMRTFAKSLRIEVFVVLGVEPIALLYPQATLQPREALHLPQAGGP